MKLDMNGFISKDDFGVNYFIPPCLFYGYINPDGGDSMNNKKLFLIFFCIPISPGNSRVIIATPRNFDVWIDRIVPRWIFHTQSNMLADSDLNLLHIQERKLEEIGPLNWHNAYYVSTKSNAHIVAFRRWLRKYGGSGVDWRNRYTEELPPAPTREQLFDRYWTYTVQCSNCNAAYKQLNGLVIALQVISVFLVGLVAATKQDAMSVASRYALVSMAVLCFVSSKWLSHFVYKTFRYHDYDHASR